MHKLIGANIREPSARGLIHCELSLNKSKASVTATYDIEHWHIPPTRLPSEEMSPYHPFSRVLPPSLVRQMKNSRVHPAANMSMRTKSVLRDARHTLSHIISRSLSAVRRAFVSTKYICAETSFVGSGFALGSEFRWPAHTCNGLEGSLVRLGILGT